MLINLKNLPEGLVACEVCLKEIPRSVGRSQRASDYVLVFLRDNCFAEWQKGQPEAGKPDRQAGSKLFCLPLISADYPPQLLRMAAMNRKPPPYAFSIGGMNCAGCVATVEKTLKKRARGQRGRVSLAERTASVSAQRMPGR